MKYFSNLKNGWADLTIGDFNCPCSYIQNIPMEILSAYKYFKKNNYCVINIDSEGYEHEIIITMLGVHIFTYRDRIQHYDLTNKFDTCFKKIQLLEDLFHDIIDNVDEWAKWLCIADSNNEKIVKEYKNTILKYVEKL